MLLDRIPIGKDFFEVVVIHCFTSDGRIILLKKRINHPLYPNLWGFVAGKVKGMESILETAHREILEETGNFIPREHIEHTGIILPTMHAKLTGEDFYFRAHVLSLKAGRFIDEIAIDPMEHACYKLEQPVSVFLNHYGTMIPDAPETFRIFCELKGLLKAT